ncbi:unnamed protein product [Nezara viridula]|uniref:Uncharacterized protein n=1 Tax=Nezara viridula TaxID=85310 RepID=A0A9P0H8M9_NEZVI|nr:unnamed protein product [Nezara viridula]
MRFVQFINILPESYQKERRKSVEQLLDSLDISLTNLKRQCCFTEIKHILFKENRNRLVAKIREKYANSMILLKGSDLLELPECLGTCFEQESCFYWAFGIEIPNLWGAIDVETETSYIIYNSYVGTHSSYTLKNPKKIKTKYGIDNVISIEEFLDEIVRFGRNIFMVSSNMDEKTLNGMSQDGVVKLLIKCGAWMCTTVLTPIIKECRMIKSFREQQVMAVATKLNSRAMDYVLRNLSPGVASYCAGDLFNLYIKSITNKIFEARPPSCLTGKSIFCLDEERSKFYSQDNLQSGDMCILDMGVALYNYKSNLITTAPINGVFSNSQAIIYNIVLTIRSDMLKELKPGIPFSHIAFVAQRTMVDQMIHNFILEGTTVEIMDTGICKIFSPNGIGHLLGIDFYDCDEETDFNSYKRGNIDQVVAKEGMIFALNSELYFNEVTIREWMDSSAGFHLQSRYLPGFFGLAARVQDVVLITSNSSQLLSDVSRTIEEIENTMSNDETINFNMPRRKPRLCVVKKEINKQSVRQIRSNLLVKKTKESKQQKLLKQLLDEYKNRFLQKPKRRLNKVMQEVYNYPFPLANMFDLTTIPLCPQRRRPNLIPFPGASSVFRKKLNYPKQGYGCPYFDWNESYVSCFLIRIIENCLNAEGIRAVIFDNDVYELYRKK